MFLGAGPIFLFPIWLLGSAAYKLNFQIRRSLSWAIFLGSITIALIAYQVDLRATLGGILPRLPYQFSPSYTRDFLYFYLIGLLVAVNLIALRGISCGIKNIPEAIARPIRFVAGVSFCLYLLHLPLMRLGEALIGDPLPYLLPTAACIAIIATCHPIERSNRVLFRWIYPLATLMQNKVASRFRN